MTHYYYYIMSRTSWEESTTIYVVAIGTSQQGKRDLEALQRYSAVHGDFFQPRTSASSEFFLRVKDSLAATNVKPTYIKARDLVRHFKQLETPTLSPNQLSAAHFQRKIIDLNYRISCNLAARKATSCQALNVKKPK